MFYTTDHEWIDFQGPVAYIGVSNFKLLGFKTIHKIKFNGLSRLAKRGEVIAWIRYNDYQIEVHMPVDGRILNVNPLFLANNLVQISEHLGKSGWIVSIAPAAPSDRKDLTPYEQYHKSITNIPVKNPK